MHLKGVLIEDRDHDTLLYAGDVQVRITDWFIFKKQAELKFIGLENAIIKFQRTDSVWRQQFIFDYFSTPTTSNKKKAGIRFNLKKVEFKNVAFIKKDAWLGEDMKFFAGDLSMDANDISLSGSNFDINTLIIKNPIVSITNYERKKPYDPLTAVEKQTHEAIDSLYSWNRGEMNIKIASLKIEDGVFRTDKQSNRPVYAHFDGQHVLFTEINADMTNARFIGDTIYSRLKLTAKERSGIEIKNLSADVKFMPIGMAFTDLDLRTNRSTIRNSFTMSYNDISEMGDYIHKVKMTANLDGSFIDSDDIAFFAPAMKTWNKKITLNGKIRGTVDDLVGKELRLQAGSSTLLNGDLSMTGLPDINQTFIDFKANDFRTTYSDAVTILPAMRKVTVPDLRKLQYIQFQGTFTGFIRDFVTFGTIQTNLGTVKTDLNMKLPRGQDAIYSGNISTDNFRLGEFLNDPKIGSISMTGIVKGKGFSERSRNTQVDGNIRYVDYNNYRYNNITVNGKLDKKLFDGSATIHDQNADLTLNGIIDFNGKAPRFDLLANVTAANLQKLNLTKNDITFAGKLDLDFTSDNIDNFLGDARITDAELSIAGERLPFDSLIVSAAYSDSGKVFNFSSNEFKGYITGDFTLEDLAPAFTHLLNKYYPAYVKAPTRLPSSQVISFDITTQYVDDYLRLIDSSISGFNNSHIYGNLNLANNELDMQAEVPQFNYKQYHFEDVKVTAKGTFDSLVVVGDAKNIRINDSLSIPLASFRIAARNDSSNVAITMGANQTVDQASINALVLTYNDGVKIEFDPSAFTINGKTWTIDQNGELQFRRNTPASGLLVLREGDQEIKLQTVPSTIGSWNDLVADLKKVNLGDISPLLLPRNRLEGLVTGKIVVEDPVGKLHAEGDITGEGLVLDNDSLGNVSAHVEYDNVTGQLIAKGKNADPGHQVEFDMSLFLKDAEKAKENHIGLKTYKYPINILERFLKTLFTDIEGYITGPVDLRGPLNQLSITGKARLEAGGLKVNFTQVFYKIQDTDVELKSNEINLDGIVLQDTITGNPVYLNGSILHESFKDMFFDIVVSTRKPGTRDIIYNQPIQLINTSYKDNKQFYGNVKGTGSFIFTGPQSEMIMQISAIASELDSSYVTIPPASSRAGSRADFLVERKYGREMSDSGLDINTSNIIYDVDIAANPMVNVKVVLDPLTGDEIKGRGNGALNIHSGTNEPLSIRGRYDIEEGNYLFTFQSFFKKPFVLRKGSDNYIEWSGDPYKARINLDAIYVAENVSFAPLAKLIDDQSVAGIRGDVYVVANMSRELFDPIFKFKLEFPPNSQASNDVSIGLNIQQMEKNDNEMTRQVSYLIVFNSFAPPETGTAGQGAFGDAFSELTFSTISSLSGVIFNQINRALTNSLSRILNTDKISINLSGSVYNRNLLEPMGNNRFNINQGNLDISIPISLFNDRLVITLGSTLDIPLASNASVPQVIQFLPDVTAEFLINPSGTIRATLFYRKSLDYLTMSSSGAGRNKSAGGSIGRRIDGDTLGEVLFGPKKKKPEAAPATTPPSTAPVAKKEEEN